MNPKELAKKVLSGHKKSLAKAMTLVCSHLEKDKKEAKILLEEVLKNSKPSYRIGVSGIGGVGKSTFIESLGAYLLKTNENIKLGVLTVDPSSPEHGGSVLADSVRMETLVSSDRVFIRSVSNKASSGGLNHEALELVLLLEGAGCDYVLIESVGIGQSDDSISLLSDTSIQLQMPASGDSMQALKKGALERADILVINKNDGLLKKEAEKTALFYKGAQHLLDASKKRDHPPVLLVSSLEKSGFDDLWEEIEKHKKEQEKTGLLKEKRTQKSLEAFDENILYALREVLFEDEKFLELRQKMIKNLEERKTSPLLAGRELVREIFS